MLNKKINFWNVDYVNKTNTRKSRDVVKYIESLELTDYTEIEQLNKFERIKEEALLQKTADEMLKVIGYNVDKEDDIFKMALSTKYKTNF